MQLADLGQGGRVNASETVHGDRLEVRKSRQQRRTVAGRNPCSKEVVVERRDGAHAAQSIDGVNPFQRRRLFDVASERETLPNKGAEVHGRVFTRTADVQQLDVGMFAHMENLRMCERTFCEESAAQSASEVNVQSREL